MDIRQEDRVFHVASGLKLQWQYSPWITSHRFQLPLRWYGHVRLIRYTFVFPATKHLVSQRDAHLLLETIRPAAALAKHLPSVLTTAAAQRWQSYGGRTYADRQHACRGSYDEVEMGSYFCLWHHDSAITNTGLQEPWWLWFFPLRPRRRSHYTRKEQ